MNRPSASRRRRQERSCGPPPRQPLSATAGGVNRPSASRRRRQERSCGPPPRQPPVGDVESVGHGGVGQRVGGRVRRRSRRVRHARSARRRAPRTALAWCVVVGPLVSAPPWSMATSDQGRIVLHPLAVSTGAGASAGIERERPRAPVAGTHYDATRRPHQAGSPGAAGPASASRVHTDAGGSPLDPPPAGPHRAAGEPGRASSRSIAQPGRVRYNGAPVRPPPGGALDSPRRNGAFAPAPTGAGRQPRRPGEARGGRMGLYATDEHATGRLPRFHGRLRFEGRA